MALIETEFDADNNNYWFYKKEKKEIAIQPAVFAIVEEKFLKDSTYRIILNGRLW